MTCIPIGKAFQKVGQNIQTSWQSFTRGVSSVLQSLRQRVADIANRVFSSCYKEKSRGAFVLSSSLKKAESKEAESSLKGAKAVDQFDQLIKVVKKLKLLKAFNDLKWNVLNEKLGDSNTLQLLSRCRESSSQ